MRVNYNKTDAEYVNKTSTDKVNSYLRYMGKEIKIKFLYQEVADKIEALILENKLKAGDKIYSIRELKNRLNASISTIKQAYDLLIAKGVIFSKEKSGYFVRYKDLKDVQDLNISYVPMPCKVKVNEMSSKMLINANKYAVANFSILAPPPELLPTSQLNKRIRNVLSDPNSSAFKYPFIEGHPDLINQIRKHIIPWNNNSILKEDILVTNGCMEAINLCLEVVTKPNDVVIIESPSYSGILQSLERFKLRAIEIPVNIENGINLEELESVVQKNDVAACVLMTRLNNPVGCSISNEQKERLLNILYTHNVPLIEDDALGECLFVKNNNHPAKSFDKKGTVLYCSSFSKTLSPGFRIGWVSGGTYHDKIKELKYSANVTTNGILQDSIAQYLKSGLYLKHLNKLGIEMKINMFKYLESIKTYFPEDIQIFEPKGGYSFWIKLNEHLDSTKLQRVALENKIGLCPGNIFSANNFLNNYIRINFCNLWNHKVDSNLEKIASLIRRLM